MALWLPIPPNFPAHGAICWVRRIAWPSVPFLATFDAITQGWTDYEEGFFVPWYDIQRWYAADVPQPPTQLTAVGTTTPPCAGTYTAIGIFNGATMFQRGSDSKFLYYYPATPEWTIYAYLSTTPANRHSTKDNADPTSVTGDYVAQGTYTGTVVLSDGS
jgi:hypothetical protein